MSSLPKNLDWGTRENPKLPDVVLRKFLELRGEPLAVEDFRDVKCMEICSSSFKAQTPKVSVCMLTYNHEAFLEQAILGVVNQKTTFPFELIIGNDCSTDRTQEIAVKYQQLYPDKIIVLSMERNTRGQENSRRVFGRARGEYVAFCEGDDYWINDDKLQMQADYLDAHPKVGLVHMLCQTDKAGEIIPPHQVGRAYIGANEGDENQYWYDYFKVGIATCTVMMRGKISAETHRVSPLLKLPLRMKDVIRWMDCLRQGYDISFIPVLTACYRVNPNSVSNLNFGYLRVFIDSQLVVLCFARWCRKRYSYREFEQKITDFQFRLACRENNPRKILHWMSFSILRGKFLSLKEYVRGILCLLKLRNECQSVS